MKQTNRKKKQAVPTAKYFKDFISRKIYEVPVSKLKEYGFYRNRYTVSIMLGILLNNFKIGNEVIIAITLGLIALMEYRYRSSFLPSLSVRQHVNVDKQVSKEAQYMNIVLYAILGILFFVYGLTGDVSETFRWVLLALGVGSAGLAVMYVNEVIALK